MCEFWFDMIRHICRTVYKKFSRFIARFQKNVITKGRRVYFMPAEIRGKEARIYGKFAGTDRDSAGD